MAVAYIAFSFLFLLTSVFQGYGLIFDDPHPCNLRDVNHFTAGPQCRTGNVSSKLDQTVNFYNSHIGSPMKVCFSRINDCSYVSSFSSCSTYTIPPSYLIITDTTGGGKLSLTVSNNEKCTQAHFGAGISVKFDFTMYVFAEVLLRYRIL